MSDFSLNSSFDMNRELLLEKRRAQDAERRMFGLRQKIASRYDDIPGMDLYAQFKLNI